MPADIGMPSLIHLMSHHWLVDQRTWRTWTGVVAALLKAGGENIVRLMDGSETASSGAPELIHDGPVAIVPVLGVLTKDIPYLGTTYGQVRDLVEQALASPGVKSILLQIDSPGGLGDGLDEMAEYIAEARQVKPIHAMVDGHATSAAYWIASAAQSIAAGATAQVGSIGVRMEHWDWSGMFEAFGLKVTDLFSGDYKVAGSPNKPLSDRDREYFQQDLDWLRSRFVDQVASARGLSAQTVHDTQARIYNGLAAKELGLIDVVASPSKFISQIKEEIMDLKTLKADHPELFAQVQAEATEGMVEKAQAEKDVQAAAQDERKRVLGLTQAVAGAEAAAKVENLTNLGISAEQAAALKETFGAPDSAAATAAPDSEAAAKTKILAGLENAAETPLAPAAAQVDEPSFDVLVEEHMEKKSCSKGEAIYAVAKANPELHEAWLAASNTPRKK